MSWKFEWVFLALGFLAAAGLAGYGLAYLIVMPEVSPDRFVPQSLGTFPSSFAATLALLILVYAFSFLPVTTLLTIRRYHTQPQALVLAGSLIGLSFIIEIFNNLPVMGAYAFPGELENVPPNVLLHLRQAETIRYLSFDVAGFSLAYVAIFIYALVFLRTHRLLAYTSLASIVLFIVNVPLLGIAPNLAVIFMVMSIFAFAPVPVLLARLALYTDS